MFISKECAYQISKYCQVLCLLCIFKKKSLCRNMAAVIVRQAKSLMPGIARGVQSVVNYTRGQVDGPLPPSFRTYALDQLSADKTQNILEYVLSDLLSLASADQTEPLVLVSVGQASAIVRASLSQLIQQGYVSIDGDDGHRREETADTANILIFTVINMPAYNATPVSAPCPLLPRKVLFLWSAQQELRQTQHLVNAALLLALDSGILATPLPSLLEFESTADKRDSNSENDHLVIIHVDYTGRDMAYVFTRDVVSGIGRVFVIRGVGYTFGIALRGTGSLPYALDETACTSALRQVADAVGVTNSNIIKASSYSKPVDETEDMLDFDFSDQTDKQQPQTRSVTSDQLRLRPGYCHPLDANCSRSDVWSVGSVCQGQRPEKKQEYDEEDEEEAEEGRRQRGKGAASDGIVWTAPDDESCDPRNGTPALWIDCPSVSDAFACRTNLQHHGGEAAKLDLINWVHPTVHLASRVAGLRVGSSFTCEIICNAPDTTCVQFADVQEARAALQFKNANGTSPMRLRVMCISVLEPVDRFTRNPHAPSAVGYTGIVAMTVTVVDLLEGGAGTEMVQKPTLVFATRPDDDPDGLVPVAEEPALPAYCGDGHVRHSAFDAEIISGMEIHNSCCNQTTAPQTAILSDVLSAVEMFNPDVLCGYMIEATMLRPLMTAVPDAHTVLSRIPGRRVDLDRHYIPGRMIVDLLDLARDDLEIGPHTHAKRTPASIFTEALQGALGVETAAWWSFPKQLANRWLYANMGGLVGLVHNAHVEAKYATSSTMRKFLVIAGMHNITIGEVYGLSRSIKQVRGLQLTEAAMPEWNNVGGAGFIHTHEQSGLLKAPFAKAWRYVGPDAQFPPLQPHLQLPKDMQQQPEQGQGQEQELKTETECEELGHDYADISWDLVSDMEMTSSEGTKSSSVPEKARCGRRYDQPLQTAPASTHTGGEERVISLLDDEQTRMEFLESTGLDDADLQNLYDSIAEEQLQTATAATVVPSVEATETSCDNLLDDSAWDADTISAIMDTVEQNMAPVERPAYSAPPRAEDAFGRPVAKRACIGSTGASAAPLQRPKKDISQVNMHCSPRGPMGIWTHEVCLLPALAGLKRTEPEGTETQKVDRVGIPPTRIEAGTTCNVMTRDKPSAYPNQILRGVCPSMLVHPSSSLYMAQDDPAFAAATVAGYIERTRNNTFAVCVTLPDNGGTHWLQYVHKDVRGWGVFPRRMRELLALRKEADTLRNELTREATLTSKEKQEVVFLQTLSSVLKLTANALLGLLCATVATTDEGSQLCTVSCNLAYDSVIALTKQAMAAAEASILQINSSVLSTTDGPGAKTSRGTGTSVKGARIVARCTDSISFEPTVYRSFASVNTAAEKKILARKPLSIQDIAVVEATVDAALSAGGHDLTSERVSVSIHRSGFRVLRIDTLHKGRSAGRIGSLKAILDPGVPYNLPTFVRWTLLMAFERAEMASAGQVYNRIAEMIGPACAALYRGHVLMTELCELRETKNKGFMSPCVCLLARQPTFTVGVRGGDSNPTTHAQAQMQAASKASSMMFFMEIGEAVQSGLPINSEYYVAKLKTLCCDVLEVLRKHEAGDSASALDTEAEQLFRRPGEVSSRRTTSKVTILPTPPLAVANAASSAPAPVRVGPRKYCMQPLGEDRHGWGRMQIARTDDGRWSLQTSTMETDETRLTPGMRSSEGHKQSSPLSRFKALSSTVSPDRDILSEGVAFLYGWVPPSIDHTCASANARTGLRECSVCGSTKFILRGLQPRDARAFNVTQLRRMLTGLQIVK